MIDIRVQTGRAPLGRIVRARRFHVFVNLFLKIDAGFTKRADYDIRTNACLFRHVSAGINECDVGWIVTGRYTRLGDCAIKHLFELRWDVGWKWIDSRAGWYSRFAADDSCLWLTAACR